MDIYIIIYHHLPIYSKSILLINTCMLCNQMIHKHWKHGKKLMENYDIGSWKREIWRALLWNQMICGKVRLGDSNGNWQPEQPCHPGFCEERCDKLGTSPSGQSLFQPAPPIRLGLLFRRDHILLTT